MKVSVVHVSGNMLTSEVVEMKDGAPRSSTSPEVIRPSRRHEQRRSHRSSPDTLSASPTNRCRTVTKSVTDQQP